MQKLLTTALVALALTCLSTGAALPATSTANLSVSIQIAAGCNISVTNIAIGAIVATQLSTPRTTTPAAGGLFTYTCSPGANTPALTASQGANYKNGSNQMKGAATGALLGYVLNLPTLAPPTGAPQSAQISASLAPATLPTVDTYTDTVVLTLTY